jgi:hypothetical protein
MDLSCPWSRLAVLDREEEWQSGSPNCRPGYLRSPSVDIRDRALVLQGRDDSRSQDTGSQNLLASRPRMERTSWATTYDGISHDILLNLSTMPYNNSADHFLGHGSGDNGPDFFSPQRDERKLYSLVIAVNRMLDRCEETMQRAVPFSAGSEAPSPRRATPSRSP